MGNFLRGVIDADALATVSRNMLAGNILRKSEKPVALTATLGNAEGSKNGIANQSATKYANALQGTSANDTLAGDVLAVAAGNISASVLVGKGGEVSGYPIVRSRPATAVTAIGLLAFNDFASGGGGRDVIAGDVYATEKGEISLTVGVGPGASSFALQVSDAGDSGSSNAAIAFNDRLFGGNGNDILSGDVYRKTAIGADQPCCRRGSRRRRRVAHGRCRRRREQQCAQLQ